MAGRSRTSRRRSAGRRVRATPALSGRAGPAAQGAASTPSPFGPSDSPSRGPSRLAQAQHFLLLDWWVLEGPGCHSPMKTPNGSHRLRRGARC